MAFEITTEAGTGYSFDHTVGNLYIIEETSIGGSDEFQIKVPKFGTIVLYQAQLTAGTAATIQPVVGKVASFSADSINEIDQLDTPLANHNVTTPARFHAPEGVLHIRSSPDAGTDNSVTTVIGIVSGWVV